MLPTIITALQKNEALEWERSLADLIDDLYVPGQHVDFESRDRGGVLEVRHSLLGLRDLDAALMHLAAITDDRNLDRATLLARFPKMSAGRVREAWERSQRLIRPELAKRLKLAAMAADTDVTLPDNDKELRKIVALAREALSHRPHHYSERQGPWSNKQFDVWMVLLDAWLRREPPLAIKDLLEISGTSTATIKATLDRLTAHGEIERTSKRAASLTGFPRRSLEEILTLTDSLRFTARFVDATGRFDIAHLTKRIRDRAPESVALGGVIAARHYMPTFDLDGTPRVDVSLYGFDTYGWVTQVDPALRLARNDERSTALVVHRVLRPVVGTERKSKDVFASPAEVLLDLYDLRLVEQAEDFVRFLRKERP